MLARSYTVQDFFDKVQVFTMLESRAGIEIFIPCRYRSRPLKVANHRDVRQCAGVREMGVCQEDDVSPELV